MMHDYIMYLPYLAISHLYPTLSMGYRGPKYLWGMTYGLQIEKSRKPTWELQKPMGYGGVCIIPGMCYVGVDCISR
jgi:hypothetical protein